MFLKYAKFLYDQANYQKSYKIQQFVQNMIESDEVLNFLWAKLVKIIDNSKADRNPIKTRGRIKRNLLKTESFYWRAVKFLRKQQFFFKTAKYITLHKFSALQQ